MKRTNYILFLALLQTMSMLAQSEPIHELEEVVLSDVRLYSTSKGNRVQVLNDSVLDKNQPVLTSVLKFNSPIHFRENGLGMVSSASFRGTSASQTAVIWNGININSSLNGQTDFNTLLTSGYDHIGIRSGGGSVLYGSGAIGGSVHLNNKFKFDRGFENDLKIQAGSFQTFFGSYQAEYSTPKTSMQFSVSHLNSENNYKYLNSEKYNENGDFENTGFSISIARLLNSTNSLRFYSTYFNAHRGLSGTATAPSNSKYEDVYSRNLLEWKGFLGQFISTLKLAYLDETYRYFENRAESRHTNGSATSGIFKYDLEYQISPKMNITVLADLNRTVGEGTNIGEAERNTASFGLLYSHELDRFSYEISTRKEFSDVYESPWLFSLSSRVNFTEYYTINASFSRNYRIPTFNDLFWTTGGKTDLFPEESLQTELGQELKIKNFRLGLTAFVINIDHLLRWIPGENGFWQPENTEKVRNLGVEAVSRWRKEWSDHQLDLLATYAFTKSKDKITGKELIYVPGHKLTGSISYKYKSISGYYQYLFTGPVFTSSDNKYSLQEYSLSNLGLEYRLLKNNKLLLGVEVRNLLNTEYESMPSRKMPGRSFNSKLNLKF